eukprot:GGOE01044524.1.p1 GENE.GGOE01044524.1~~GGOE01044524.1.p1  ORF type:complete len:256 (+),score=26.84 GGOE01044524.1:895-1662(+)
MGGMREGKTRGERTPGSNGVRRVPPRTSGAEGRTTGTICTERCHRRSGLLGYDKQSWLGGQSQSKAGNNWAPRTQPGHTPAENHHCHHHRGNAGQRFDGTSKQKGIHESGQQLCCLTNNGVPLISRRTEEAGHRDVAEKLMRAEKIDNYYTNALGITEKLFGVRFGPQNDLQPDTVQFSLTVPQGSGDTIFFVKVHSDSEEGHQVREVEVLDCNGVVQPQFRTALAAALSRTSSLERQLFSIIGVIRKVHCKADQ